MKEAAVALQVAAILASFTFVYFIIGAAMEPLESPQQYGQFCDAKKVSGQGAINISSSIEDDETCLGYSSSLEGDGYIEIDQVQEYSQKAEKLTRRVDSINSTADSNLNLFENLKLVYSGSTPLIGERSLSSAIGAVIEENFEANEMEKKQISYCTSTKDEPENMPSKGTNPVHIMGVDLSSKFNGKWGTDATWNETPYKELRAHQAFDGNFEVEKSIKFHESPLAEETEALCAGIDC